MDFFECEEKCSKKDLLDAVFSYTIKGLLQVYEETVVNTSVTDSLGRYTANEKIPPRVLV